MILKEIEVKILDHWFSEAFCFNDWWNVTLNVLIFTNQQTFCDNNRISCTINMTHKQTSYEWSWEKELWWIFRLIARGHHSYKRSCCVQPIEIVRTNRFCLERILSQNVQEGLFLSSCIASILKYKAFCRMNWQ